MIDVNSLPVATEDDLQRVGQYLYYAPNHIVGHIVGAYRAVCVASGKKNCVVGYPRNCGEARKYRLLTESQAIELARTMPHVDEAWRAGWPSEVPAFDDVRVGDSFEEAKVKNVRRRIVKELHSEGILLEDGGFFTEGAWKHYADNDHVANCRRAEAPTTGPSIASALPGSFDSVPADFVPSPKPALGPTPEYVIEHRMQEINDAYAARQEQDKAAIIRQWRQPWTPGTNGNGSLTCELQRRGR